MVGLIGKAYPNYSEMLYGHLRSLVRDNRQALSSMIDEVRESEHTLCNGEYFTFSSNEYENLSDDCRALAELDRIFTKLHDGNFHEL